MSEEGGAAVAEAHPDLTNGANLANLANDAVVRYTHTRSTIHTLVPQYTHAVHTQYTHSPHPQYTCIHTTCSSYR